MNPQLPKKPAIRPIKTALTALTAVAAFGSLHAAVYTVQAAKNFQTLEVKIELDPGKTATEFQMPAWAPGDYRIIDFGKALSNVTFKNGDNLVQAEHIGRNDWKPRSPVTSVSYSVADKDPVVFSDFLRITKDEYCFDGPAVLGCFVGHTNEKHTLKIVKTIEGPVVCALDELESNDKNIAEFTAPNYDVLVDNPVIHSKNIRIEPFMVYGKPHKIVAFNKSARVDMKSYVDVCTKIVTEGAKMFGGLPYAHYYFLFDFGGGGGGLEHASCTRIGLDPSPSAVEYTDFIAHEFFHAWNVKRIRAKPLGPFDYTKPAITGALWWLEGVTDYYAKILSVRSGIWSRTQFLRSISESIASIANVPARKRVSADECSRRVWEANNSEGYGGMSYYLKGELIGACLDMAIRSESDGTSSLDDVMRALYKECSDGKPGFAENRIRELCVVFGGEALGPLYDECVMKPGDVPIDRYLPKLGFTWDNWKGIVPDPQAPSAALNLGAAWPGPSRKQ